MTDIRCLTLHAHWAAAIFERGKDVENRVWSTDYRGRVAIHAGSKIDRGICQELGLDPAHLVIGAILGTVDLVDVVRNSSSRWATSGHYHWILRNPQVLSRPLPRRGQLGLYRVCMDSGPHVYAPACPPAQEAHCAP